MKSVSQNREALVEYEAKQRAIRKLLREIEAGLDKHDRRASSQPGGHHWGHVGDLGSIIETLIDLKDRLHGTGEYAEVAQPRERKRYRAYGRNGKLMSVSVPED
jgi:hypothetical protein